MEMSVARDSPVKVTLVMRGLHTLKYQGEEFIASLRLTFLEVYYCYHNDLSLSPGRYPGVQNDTGWLKVV